MNNPWNKQTLFSTTPASIRKGDHAAFQRIYLELHIRVFHFFRKRGLIDDTAKDLTQQTFIRLWQFRHTLSEEHPLEKQIFIIAHSLLVNHFEKVDRQKRALSTQVQLVAEQPIYPGRHESFELANHIKTAIDILPPIRKQILILKIFHDYSNREIATRMDISIKTVEDHITKAFRRIRDIGIGN